MVDMYTPLGNETINDGVSPSSPNRTIDEGSIVSERDSSSGEFDQESQNGYKILSSEIVIERFIVVDTDMKDCPVCQYEMEVYSLVIQLKCLHVFHFDCVEMWIRKAKACPLCRELI